MKNDCTFRSGISKLFHWRPDSNILGFVDLNNACYKYSALLWYHESSHRQKIKEWLYSNQILFTRNGGCLDLAHGHHLLTPTLDWEGPLSAMSTFLSLDLPILDVSYKWNHMWPLVSSFFHLACFWNSYVP